MAGLVTPTHRTISFVPTPSAASSTIRARCASPTRIDGTRSHNSQSRRGTSTVTANDVHQDLRNVTLRSSYIAHRTLRHSGGIEPEGHGLPWDAQMSAAEDPDDPELTVDLEVVHRPSVEIVGDG